MAELDPALLARVQFAFTVSFHIIFPTMSIGLVWFLVMVEGLWLKTGDPLYQQIYRFWLNIFAMSFAVGVVTGIVLSFEFGLAFARFSELAGPVIGPLIVLEVLTSFFLEAGFLGIMLFGAGRVGPRLHFFATCMVAVGTLFSASWILAANSWMQTPDGVAWQAGHLVVTDWWRVVVNPSWPVRLPHMLLAAFLTGAFLVSGVSAWYLLRSRETEFARRTLLLGMASACVLRDDVADGVPFALGMAMVLSGVASLGLAFFPNVIPFKISLWQAASGTASHVFLLIGVGLVTPVVLGYSAFAYSVFRGKTPAEGWEP